MSIKVTKMFIYPVKSCKGIEVDRASLDRLGFELDRRWMVIRDESPKGSWRYISQREVPKMALIVPSFEEKNGNPRHTLCVDAPDMETLRINVNAQETKESEALTVRIFDEKVKCRLASADASEWFSKYMAGEYRLVTTLSTAGHHRPINADFDPTNQKVHCSFPDVAPLLLTNEKSLAELNSKTSDGKKREWATFRPNIVVDGDIKGFAEDGWKRITIGDLEFVVMVPSDRCVLTTVDQTTGAKPGVQKEPLIALRKFRKVRQNVFFGQNIVHCKNGEVKVGQSVVVTERGEHAALVPDAPAINISHLVIGTAVLTAALFIGKSLLAKK